MFTIEKVANAIILANNLGVRYLGKTKLMKLLFLIDREHLQRYGRPVFNDIYVKKPMGPVPVNTYAIVSSVNDPEKEDFTADTSKLEEWVEVSFEPVNRESPMMKFRNKKEFDESFFSETELEVMREIFKKFADALASDLISYTHDLPEYKSVASDEIIEPSAMAGELRDYVKFWEEEKEDFFYSLQR